MGIRLWDFTCKTCGQAYPSYPYEGRRPTSIPCHRCDGQATWAMQRSNLIHPTASGRKYGQFDPQFGCVVRDYSHKKHLLKEMGMHELPPESLEEARHAEAPADTGERDPNVVVLDDLSELEALIPRDRVDSKASGGKRPAQDMWVKF